MPNVSIDHLAPHAHSIPLIAEWLLREFGYLEPNVSAMEFAQRLTNRTVASNYVTTCVSLLDNQVTGTASLIESDGIESCADFTPWLADMYVVPAWRCHGHGDALVKFIIEHAQRCGFSRLYLYTDKQQRFFAKHGWRLLKDVDHHGARVSVMQLVLGEAPQMSREKQPG